MTLLAGKVLCRLLRGLASNCDGERSYINCLYSYTTKRLKSHGNISKDYEYCHIISEEGKNILKCNQHNKSLKVSFIIFVVTETLLEKVHTCHGNPEESSITQISKHMTCVNSLFTNCSFDNSKSKHLKT